MYEDYFGFTGQPFHLNPDPSFYFESRGHKRAFAYLTYGLYQGEGFIVITGEVGAGKTTLVRCLLEQIDTNRIVAANLVSTQLDAEDLLRSVATAFGVRTKAISKARLLAELEAYFVSLVPLGKRPVLIVDEAQNLTRRAVEELRMLSNFQLGNTALLQSILIGQPELRDLMRSADMKQLGQRVLASYHLGPMDRDEIRQYIEHRLSKVGWKGDPKIEADFYDAVHLASGGIPRRINSLCNRVLLLAFLNEKHVIAASDLAEVLEELKDESALGLEVDPQETAEAIMQKEFTDSDIQASRLWRMLSSAESVVRLRQGRAGRDGGLSTEERVERLERAIMTVLDVVTRMVHRQAQKEEAAPPEPQPAVTVSEPPAFEPAAPNAALVEPASGPNSDNQTAPLPRLTDVSGAPAEPAPIGPERQADIVDYREWRRS